MRLRFLGTGTSFGVPVIGCTCETCTSEDPRDRRTRHAALVEGDHGGRLLVDTPPELRLQLLRADAGRPDAVWLTHCHADHTHGLDDLRAFSVRGQGQLPLYAGPDCLRAVRRRFDYIFGADAEPVRGTSRPDLRLEMIHAGEDVEAAGFVLRPIALPHGPMRVFGFRTGELGYVTDAKRLPSAAREVLRGVRTLVINALWFGNPHPTHFNVEEAVEQAREIGAERTYLTHLAHQVRHEELLEALPAGIEPAYDGLEVEV